MGPMEKLESMALTPAAEAELPPERGQPLAPATGRWLPARARWEEVDCSPWPPHRERAGQRLRARTRTKVECQAVR